MKAMKKIKAVCKAMEYCMECPFYSLEKELCTVKTPGEWKFKRIRKILSCPDVQDLFGVTGEKENKRRTQLRRKDFPKKWLKRIPPFKAAFAVAFAYNAFSILFKLSALDDVLCLTENELTVKTIGKLIAKNFANSKEKVYAGDEIISLGERISRENSPTTRKRPVIFALGSGDEAEGWDTWFSGDCVYADLGSRTYWSDRDKLRLPVLAEWILG